MITRIRIDDRLLHGQVAYSWKSALGYNAIVIANENAANDPIRKSALKMAKPEGVKIAIRNPKEAIELVNNELLKKMTVFIVCDSPKDAYEIYSNIDEKPTITLGGMQKREGTDFFSPAVFVSPEDVTYLDKLVEENAVVEVKQVPDEKDKKYSDLRKNFNP